MKSLLFLALIFTLCAAVSISTQLIFPGRPSFFVTVIAAGAGTLFCGICNAKFARLW